MEFTLFDLDHNIHQIVGLIGYVSLDHEGDEFKLICKMGIKDYPRFHLLARIINGGDRGHGFILSIENSSQSGDAVHENPLIREETKRIKELLMKGLES